MKETGALVRKALWLEYFTVGWNIIEGIIAISAGVVAGSIALVGFGLDSGIESISGSALIWRLRKHGTSAEEESAAEKRAILLVGLTFLLLAGYVMYESLEKLLTRDQPESSLVGIILAAVSLAVMPLLAWQKRSVANDLGSRALAADAMETLACSYLSFTLLIGLGANVLFGWWWADPLVALVMVFFLVREGVEAIREGSEPIEETEDIPL